MIWYLLFIPAIIFVVIIFLYGVGLTYGYELAGKMFESNVVFWSTATLILFVLLLNGIVVDFMSTPVLNESVYDKIAVELFWKG